MFAIILSLVVIFIVSGVYLLYKSAKKFNLSDEQLERIKKRNQQLDEEQDDQQSNKP